MKARIKRLVANPGMLMQVLETGSAIKITKGCPPGAKFRGATIDPLTQMIHIFVEHSSFEEVNVETEVAGSIETLFKKIQ